MTFRACVLPVLVAGLTACSAPAPAPAPASTPAAGGGTIMSDAPMAATAASRPHIAGVSHVGPGCPSSCVASTPSTPQMVEATAPAVLARGMNSPARMGTKRPTPISV